MNPRTPLGRLRRQAGFNSLEKAARALGISRIHLSQVESGSGGASEELAAKISSLYGVSVEVITEHLNEARKQHFETKLETLPESEDLA